jgi:hypothetical protein
MKPKSSTDDQSTVSIRRQDDIPTVSIPGSKQPKPARADTDLDLIHSYWRSGLPALKRQAISRYAQLKGVSLKDAETALQSTPAK